MRDLRHGRIRLAHGLTLRADRPGNATAAAAARPRRLTLSELSPRSFRTFCTRAVHRSQDGFPQRGFNLARPARTVVHSLSGDMAAFVHRSTDLVHMAIHKPRAVACTFLGSAYEPICAGQGPRAGVGA